MKTKIWDATFIGKNSMGYENGKTYTIIVQQQGLWRQFSRGWVLEIWRENGTGYCPYESIHSFIQNWRITPDQPK